MPARHQKRFPACHGKTTKVCRSLQKRSGSLAQSGGQYWQPRHTALWSLPTESQHPEHPHHAGVQDVVILSVKTTALRSEEHTSELQSRPHHVCRLLPEIKNVVI